jgi:RNA ligase (TIGR02306 family)
MRKLATIQRIAEIKPIEGADKICSYGILGWYVTDQIGKYKVGDLVVYIEADAFVPSSLAPFLTKEGKEPRCFNGVLGEKLRTVKLKGVLSQGLLLPLSAVFELHADTSCDIIYTDVTGTLGIQLYEAPVPACLAGLVRGNFPVGIPKTEATRIQNLSNEFWEELKTHAVEITEKLNGSSASFILDTEGDFHVCSRNLDLKPDENNSFWKIAYKHDVERLMKLYDLEGLAIQGELIGEGINGNQYKVGLEFVVFNIYNTNKAAYMSEKDRLNICSMLGLKHVPVLYTGVIHKDNTVQETLKLAEGKSALNASNREGFVIKSQKDTGVIVKVISNAWLLKNGD